MKDRLQSGPDPAFPYLDENQRYRFPNPLEGKGDIIAVGGNLSPGMLLSAYEQGLFPWYNPEDPVLWQSPDPRFVLFPKNLHISQSMAKVLKKNTFTVHFDRNFPAVIQSCAAVIRSGKNHQPGTWITDDIIAGYTALHRLGWAHSAESYTRRKTGRGLLRHPAGERLLWGIHVHPAEQRLQGGFPHPGAHAL